MTAYKFYSTTDPQAQRGPIEPMVAPVAYGRLFGGVAVLFGLCVLVALFAAIGG